jgi:hypothetical protein
MKRSDCHFKNLIKASTGASTSNIIVKILLSTKASAELIEYRNGGHQGRMGGLKQNFEPNNNLFFKTVNQATL